MVSDYSFYSNAVNLIHGYRPNIAGDCDELEWELVMDINGKVNQIF